MPTHRAFALLLAAAALPAAAAHDPAPVACRDLGYTQMMDLRLARKLEEGPEAFARFVRRQQFMRQWSMDEALTRAHNASVTECAGELGLKPQPRRERRHRAR